MHNVWMSFTIIIMIVLPVDVLAPSFLAPLVEKTVLSPLTCLCIFVQNQLTTHLCIYTWTLCAVLLIYLLPVLQCLDKCIFTVSLEIR